ncbi:hypothetical protein JCM10908_007024 [Rhodotorula pacifica]|uniref:uncharacterized protein n=1 Tax=Rhodotorula pacifica TaxID=1495444 RepID=UPI0031750D67
MLTPLSFLDSASHPSARTQLANAYSALATELTRTEIRTIGGYSLGRIIGEGTFGKVRLGVHRLTGTRVAIKQVPKSLPSYSPSDPSSPLSLLTREIHHHRRLRHPHVLSLFELVATESSIYLVTELCAGGELFDYLVEQTRLSLAETRRIFGQLVLGVAYLHGEGVVHRDLKLENVLLDENVNVKIADLGFGREFEKGRFMETRVGTLGYMAPEVVAGQRYLGEEVDIWSLGVILFALLTGSLPFDDDDEGIMKQLILDCKYEVPEWLDEDAASLVQSILVRDPLRRASLKDILSHPFFTRSRAPSAAPSAPASPSTSTHLPLLNSPGLGLSDSGVGDGERAAPSTFFAPTPSSSSSPPHLLSEVQRGKQRASDPPPASLVPLTPLGTSSTPSNSVARSHRPSALPPHMASVATSPTPRIRRHPSTASIDFGPSAPAPSAPLFPPAMQRTSSAGAVSISSVRGAATPISQAGLSNGVAAGPGRRRRSVGSVRSLRMQDLAEDETLPPLRSVASRDDDAAYGPSPRVASSSVGSVDEDDEQENGDGDGDGGGDAQVLVEEEEERIDYVSLLLTTSEAPPLLSTPEEQSLLQQLSLLGFDGGQVSHSVRTSACDSCSAIWWMLRRKRDAEAELALAATSAAAADDGEGEVGEGKLSRTNSLRSIRRFAGTIRDPAAVLNDPPDDVTNPPLSRLYRDDLLESLTEEQGPLSPLPTLQPPELSATPADSPSPSRERTSSRGALEFPARAPSPPHTPPKRPSIAPGTPTATLTSPTMVTAPATPSAKAAPRSSDDAEARLSFFLNASDAPASVSASAILSYFPTVDAPSQTSPSAKRSQSISHDIHPGDTARSPSGDDFSPDDGSRRDRARAGSVGLLARATSAIGQGFASLSQAGTAEDVEGGATPRSGPTKLPPPQAQRATTALPGHLSALDQTSVDRHPSRPPAVHASASAPTSAQSYSPIIAVSPLPRPAPLLVSSLPASPARSTSQRALHATESSTTTSTSASSRSEIPGRSPTLGRSISSSVSSQGGKKNKGGNLLNTFKHWFGQDPRKRKRVSMSPRLGAIGGEAPSAGGITVGRSHSMYVGTVLARASAPLAIAGRPQMGSRKSSYNSAYAGAPASGGSATISRRSSVSSAHRTPYLSDHATPMRAGQTRRRRLSDASRTSRTSLSERGDHSRPSSVRSHGGAAGGSATRRHRHSTGASSSPSGSYVTAKEVYRRPPTTTTVRRRHGSRGRHSSEIATSGARHHRRTASGASSMHRSSSGSMIAGAGSDEEGYVDEDDVGEDPIMEEDEEEGERGTGGALTDTSEHARDAARAKALRVLSGMGEDVPTIRVEGLPTLGATLPRSSSSSPAMSSANTSLRSSIAASSHHATTTFTAHKATHLFGSPLQPHAPPHGASSAAAVPSYLSRRATVPAHAPRRDVFAPKETNGEWVDEDDELSGYGGGLGQGNTNATTAAQAQPSRSPSTRNSHTPVSGPQVSPGLAGYVDSPVAGKIWSTGTAATARLSTVGGGGPPSSSVARFEGRYAGVAAGAAISPTLGGDTSALGNGSGAVGSGARLSKWTQAAPDIVEEEEE